MGCYQRKRIVDAGELLRKLLFFNGNLLDGVTLPQSCVQRAQFLSQGFNASFIRSIGTFDLAFDVTQCVTSVSVINLWSNLYFIANPAHWTRGISNFNEIRKR